MKGFVPTPHRTVDLMVAELFRDKSPRPEDKVLDPGCGTGAFVGGLLRWCCARRIRPPKIVGVESNPYLAAKARAVYGGHASVEIRDDDFLTAPLQEYHFVIGNPPYVPITGLSEREKALYRKLFKSARGRFDLYLLFFEQALRSLKPQGRLVLITPEKFLYVETAFPLRAMLAQKNVQEIRLIDEQTFGSLVTYPTVTTVTNSPGHGSTLFVLRDSHRVRVLLPHHGGSWLPLIHGSDERPGAPILADICVRVSCGVATGADSIFVHKAGVLEDGLRSFAFTTIAGRQLSAENPDLRTRQVMLIPYARDGRLLGEVELGALVKYLRQPPIRAKLLRRTCARRKPWYAFHESPPLPDILRPKILCKDITAKPTFWIDRSGELVPRHSVYYIIPKRAEEVDALCTYLNSVPVREWLDANCQRAANGFLRLQSRVLKRLPLPMELVERARAGGAARLLRVEAARSNSDDDHALRRDYRANQKARVS
ncbi:MAG: Eco57I restriction-modification methylase domain-containing protein [Candidatus Binataceae bacterium]